MSTSTLRRAAVAASSALVLIGSTGFSRADVKDYEFQLVSKDIKKGEAILSVRLVHKPDGKAVPDAVIIATRLDMAPEGMQEMTTKVTPAPSAEPGIYQFKADVSMAGSWQLSLGAKVQGETGTVENKLVLKAAP